MKLTLTPFLQRVAALAIAGLLVFALVTMIVGPMWAASSAHAERVEMLQRQASKMKGLAEAEPRYAAALKTLAGNADVQQLTFAAPQPTLAVAQLQSKLGEIFAASPAVVTMSQALPESKDGVLTKIAVQATIEVDIKGLTAALHAIDAARPLLHVDKCVFRDPDGEWANPPQGRASNVPNKLQVEIVVSAYMRAP